MTREMALLACVATAAIGCSTHKVTHNPQPPLEMPSAYTAAGAQAPMPEKWWTEFSDPQLETLIDDMLSNNFQLRAAWARIKQARAFVKQAHSGKYPQLDLSGAVQRNQSRFNFGNQVIINEINLFNVSAAAGYEIDLWRRMASTGNAAALDALALRDDVEAIAITLIAEVAEAWFDLLSVSAQLKLLTDQYETNKLYLELIELRFQKGLASSLDIYQQRQQLVSTQAQMTLLEGTKALSIQRLAILVGKPPEAIAVTPGEVLPGLPATVPGTGLPADLLERRPDVRAARRRVEAADYRVAVAVADRLPALRLSASLGLQSPTLGDFLTSPVWNLLAGVAAPLIDGGRRKAEVERQKAVVEERLMNYGQVLLQAMVEVESALTNEARQRAYITELEQLVELSGLTLEQAQERYNQGLIDYLPVLSALQGRQRAELTLLQARRSLLSFRIQLCRALGGTWTEELADPSEENTTAEDTVPTPPGETGAKEAATEAS